MRERNARRHADVAGRAARLQQDERDEELVRVPAEALRLAGDPLLESRFTAGLDQRDLDELVDQRDVAADPAQALAEGRRARRCELEQSERAARQRSREVNAEEW